MPALTMGRKRRFDVLFFAFFQIHCAQQRRVARRYWKAFHICPHHLQQQRMLHPSSLEAALTAISQTRLITQYEPMGIARIQFWRHQARWNKCCFVAQRAFVFACLEIGGAGRSRTGLDGFAIRCITALLPRQRGMKKGSWTASLFQGMWSGKRVSNSRPQPWQGCALPTELFPRCMK